MILKKNNLLLADDDKDDCLLFKEALEELQLQTTLTTVHDGEQLMQFLKKNPDELFDVLFLDVNMPRKNGFASLEEIKSDKKLRSLPVIIFSTSYDKKSADLLYKNGAQYYVCKPIEYSHLKKVIYRVLELVSEKDISQPARDKFLLSDSKAILI